MSDTPNQEADPYWEYQEQECWNCGGEGYVYGCSWDWQCDTYDEGEGSCLCTRACHVCHPPKADPAMQQILADALARDSDGSPKGGDACGSVHDSAGRQASPEHGPGSVNIEEVVEVLKPFAVAGDMCTLVTRRDEHGRHWVDVGSAPLWPECFRRARELHDRLTQGVGG